MKTLTKLTLSILAASSLAMAANSNEVTFKSNTINSTDVSTAITQALQAQGWSDVSVKEGKIVAFKEYTKRLRMNSKPIKRVHGTVQAQVDFSNTGFSVTPKGDAQHHKATALLSSLSDAIVLNVAQEKL
jgi:hypothetical protein